MPNFNCRVSGILIKDNKVLIIKRNKDYLISDNSDNKFCGWEFCGGGIEHNEQPKSAIIREYREEVGLEVLPKLIIHSRTGIRNNFPLLNIVYLCEYLNGEVKLTNEHIKYKWVNLEELKSYDMGEHVSKDANKFLNYISKSNNSYP